MKAKNQIQAAKTLGSIAYAKGIACAPCLDVDFQATLNRRQVGYTPNGEAPTATILAAWTKGWVEASLI